MLAVELPDRNARRNPIEVIQATQIDGVLIRLVDELPKGPSGKVQRLKLLEL